MPTHSETSTRYSESMMTHPVNSGPGVEADRIHLCGRHRATDKLVDNDWHTDEGVAHHEHDINEVRYAWRAVDMDGRLVSLWRLTLGLALQIP
jgi:hypothetical protein